MVTQSLGHLQVHLDLKVLVNLHHLLLKWHQKLLQKLLKIEEDGTFGPATTQALMLAQKQHGLVADGICGPASWKALSGADKYLKKL